MADAFLSLLTEGAVRNGVLLGESWESLCARKVKAPPSAKATLAIKTELAPDEAQVARTLYAQGLPHPRLPLSLTCLGVVTNPDLDLDEIVDHLLQARRTRLGHHELERARQLQSELHPSYLSAIVKIKHATNGHAITFTSLQFATYFGEHAIVQVLATAAETTADALVDAAREGYATIVACLLSKSHAHVVGRAFVAAAAHAHLDVLDCIFDHAPDDLRVLCQGAWCTRDQLGMRYVAAAAHATVDANSVDGLRWFLDKHVLFAFELERVFTTALALASASDAAALAFMPLLALLVHKEPMLAAVARAKTNSRRAAALTTHVLLDLHMHGP
ncbi:Aste57867_21430 [Aphanomyces stellatus]|uniref:Aste57867_21430 protein n=1 Tax=Aphanomyces stellatus TaxID=120398 RepID=A0A485LHJ0_9STRA|nr:hypothetical protein As57867_021361 [Aphanomyces stellatus]VFT98101.1 Aste57867_21430 [Aphanomyces stellatus]